LACLGLGQVYLRRGEFQKAMSVQQRALELIQTWKIPTWFPWAAASFGYALTLAGNLSEGMKFLDDATQRAVAIRFLINHSLWLVWLGEAHLLAGRMDKAATIAEQALSLCRDRSERGHMAWAFRLQGEIFGRGDRGESGKAEEFYRRSLTLAEELGMHPLVAHCHLGLGRLYRRTGDQMQSQEHFTVATTLFRKMEMGFWLEEANKGIEKRG
jgi:tetratricopeptide (TPR) repeat protein